MRSTSPKPRAPSADRISYPTETSTCRQRHHIVVECGTNMPEADRYLLFLSSAGQLTTSVSGVDAGYPSGALSRKR